MHCAKYVFNLIKRVYMRKRVFWLSVLVFSNALENVFFSSENNFVCCLIMIYDIVYNLSLVCLEIINVCMYFFVV